MISFATPLIENSSGQSVAAAVTLECNPPDGGSINIDVNPGATLTGYTICTVSNPTVHVEKISIDVQSNGMAVAAPGSITVAAGGEEDFQVTVRADPRTPTQARTLYVDAFVQEISGVPPPNSASASSSNIVNIMQFAEFNVEMATPIVELEVGGDYELDYFLQNTGNGLDNFKLDLEDGQSEEGSYSLTSTKVQADWGSFSWFRVLVDAPNDGSDWTIDSAGRHTFETDIQVIVESDLGCQNGDCLTTSMNQKIIFYQNQTMEDDSGSNLLSSSIDSQVLIFGGGGTVAILLIILFVIMLRRKNT
jgi:hypothetical protein